MRQVINEPFDVRHLKDAYRELSGFAIFLFY